jgi:hypothetical protein
MSCDLANVYQYVSGEGNVDGDEKEYPVDSFVEGER